MLSCRFVSSQLVALGVLCTRVNCRTLSAGFAHCSPIKPETVEMSGEPHESKGIEKRETTLKDEPTALDDRNGNLRTQLDNEEVNSAPIMEQLSTSAAQPRSSTETGNVKNKQVADREKKRKPVKTTEQTVEEKRIRLEEFRPFQSGKREYYFQNGLRKVYPYDFEHRTHAKGRWVGRSLLDVFVTEFRAQTKEYYEDAIQNGRLRVNGTVQKLDYIVKNNDLLENWIHRHEVPVIGCPINIIHEDNGMLVIDKPPSLPVHPCGRYNHNSVLSILAHENNITELHTLHRLDRLTSGVLMFAKTIERSRYMDKLIQEHKVQKEYLCRVDGEFPADKDVVVDKRIKTFSFKIGVCGVSDEGREAKTIFRRLSYNGRSSVVIARPQQGRMHQIRVHLQYLGHPIVNDPLYNDEVFGRNKAKGGLTEKSVDQLLADMISVHTLENWLKPMTDEELEQRIATYGKSRGDSKVEQNDETFFDSYPDSLLHYITDDFKHDRPGYDVEKMTFQDWCDECKRKYIDPSPSDLLIYLHCYKYTGPDFSYQSEFPDWASENWTVD